MIATNIPLFQVINQLPIRLNISPLDDGGRIEVTVQNITKAVVLSILTVLLKKKIY